MNVLVALLDLEHVHHETAFKWFNIPGRQWALCPFTEVGLLRHFIRPTTGGLTFSEATAMLATLTKAPGFQYEPIASSWQALCAPLLPRLFGHNQITDAYLLGVALQARLVLVTFDKAILHLAGEHANRVLLLQ